MLNILMNSDLERLPSGKRLSNYPIEVIAIGKVREITACVPQLPVNQKKNIVDLAIFSNGQHQREMRNYNTTPLSRKGDLKFILSHLPPNILLNGKDLNLITLLPFTRTPIPSRLTTIIVLHVQLPQHHHPLPLMMRMITYTYLDRLSLMEWKNRLFPVIKYYIIPEIRCLITEVSEPHTYQMTENAF